MINITSKWVKLDYDDEVKMEPYEHYLIIAKDRATGRIELKLHSDVRKIEYKGDDCIATSRCVDTWDIPCIVYTQNNKWKYGKCMICKIELPKQYYNKSI